MNAVRAIAVVDGNIWAASSGGAFVYHTADNTFGVFTNSEGLSSNDLTAVTVDPLGQVWVGGGDGALNVRDPQTGTWRSLRDIQLSERIQKGVRTFSASGDSLFIGTDFGVSVFLLGRAEFGDTYANFGFAGVARVNGILILPEELWIATSQGVARAPRTGSNLSSPTSWTRFTTANGLPAGNVTSILSFHDTVLVGTGAGAAWFDGSTFQSAGVLAGKSVVGLGATGSSVFATWNEGGDAVVGSLTSVGGSVAEMGRDDSTTAQCMALSGVGPSIWIGTLDRGLSRLDGGSWQQFMPNGPVSNLFISVGVGQGGMVWGASGTNGGGKGFYRYDPSAPPSTRWESFTQAEYPQLQTNDYYKISPVSGGRVWVSSWGYGVVEMEGDRIVRKLDATSNPSLAAAVPNNLSYVVVGGVAEDAEGGIWFVDRTAVDGNVLARLVNDTSFVRYKNVYNPGEGRFTALVIDRNGTKWLANNEAFGGAAVGLFYFNEQSIVPGTESTSGWGYMSTTDGLPHNSIVSLAVDVDGNVCVGTVLGMMIITDPLYPKQRRISSYPLREQVIQAIAVDGENNKWVGTKEGLFVVNADGTQLLQQYTVNSTNGKLLDNDIRSLAIDQQRGILYIGTEKGLSGLGIPATQAVRSYATLRVAPNPFLVPSDQPAEIRDLVPDSYLKILTVEGTLVKEFRAQGAGRAFWDGLDVKGDLVGTGIYFIVAFAENGDQVGTGKIAVIRR